VNCIGVLHASGELTRNEGAGGFLSRGVKDHCERKWRHVC
jgi:hypothetical protein